MASMSLPHHHHIMNLLFPLVFVLILQFRVASTTFACGSAGAPTFVPNSTYERNLKLLLADMSATTPIYMEFNSTQGKPPDEVFGHALCINSRSRSICSTCADPVCKDCIDTAISSGLVSCANWKIATGIFDNCTIGWTNKIPESPPPSHPPPNPMESPPPPPPQILSNESPPPVVTPYGKNVTTREGTGGGKTVLTYAVAIPVVLVLGAVAGVLWFLSWKRWRNPETPPLLRPAPDHSCHGEVPKSGNAIMYSYRDLINATAGFAASNLLGEGGFGPVYKGTLQDGQQIAVKKLENGWQGIEQLGNEVRLLPKLQHRNLVSVLGYCMEEKEAMLVYEFVPNTSLDKILLDPSKCEQLTWDIRFKIITGIGRGILYLQVDSRKLVIHRDLKTSNILLDEQMNPKISDFGLAKLYDDTETQANTRKLAGTLGYIAPECIQCGEYSFKSDVYSFGIIILELVTGRLAVSFDDRGRGLVNYVIQHWNENSPLRALDPKLGGVCLPAEVTRSLYVGLLCSKMDKIGRPDMGAVVDMLSSQMTMSEMSTITI